jgi:hypothetical protein
MKNLKIFGPHKQWFCVVILALLCAGTAFTQAKPAAAAASGKKNAISFSDTMLLFNGFNKSNSDAHTFFFYLSPSYERLIAPHFTIGGELDTCFGSVLDVGYFYLGMAFVGRYYAMSEKMEKFYLGANLGFNMEMRDGKTDYGFVGLLIGLEAGYKLLLGSTFFVEPSMAYVYSKSGSGPTPTGWHGGLRIGIEF